MKTTTDISVLSVSPARYTWGLIMKFHKIGEYTIGEYHPWKIKGSVVLTGIVDNEVTLFHSWLGTKDLCRDACSLDEALLVCMSNKYDGPNAQFVRYAMRMLKGNN